MQRFGSALQLTPHFHTIGFCALLGTELTRSESAGVPTRERDVEELVERVHAKVLGLLRRRGLLVDEDADYDPDSSCVDDPVLASCYAHALRVPQQRLSMAPPRPGSKPVSKSRRCAKFGGFDLHAAVTVSPDDRYALERLCRYLCRPALSNERLELLDDAHVGLELKTPFSDGTSHLALTFDELLQRLCALVPRPGTHRVHYHGILAPAARHRSKVVPEPDVEPCPELTESDDTALLGFDDDSPLRKRRKTVRKLLWAELLQRVFDLEVLKCPSCGGPSAGDRDHCRGADCLRSRLSGTIGPALELPIRQPRSYGLTRHRLARYPPSGLAVRNGLFASEEEGRTVRAHASEPIVVAGGIEHQREPDEFAGDDAALLYPCL